MIVLDSSAAVDWLVEYEHGPWVDEQIRGEDLHSPHLLDVEVLGVVQRRVQRRELSIARARAILEDLSDLDVARYPHLPLLGRMWELRDNLAATDACYVALAELLGARVVTTDLRLARAPGLRVEITAP